MFNAPIEVILTNQDVFVPDLLVVANLSHISQRGIERPPLLVVEILSPSTRKVDQGVKARRYAELGVEHYWVVDPERERVECYELREGTFCAVVDGAGRTMLAHPRWDGLVVDLAALW